MAASSFSCITKSCDSQSLVWGSFGWLNGLVDCKLIEVGQRVYILYWPNWPHLIFGTQTLLWKEGRSTVRRSLNAPKWCIITRSSSVLLRRGSKTKLMVRIVSSAIVDAFPGGAGSEFPPLFSLSDMLVWFLFYCQFLCFSRFLFNCFPPEMSRMSTCSWAPPFSRGVIGSQSS